jgi:hypothetical protein
MDATADLRAALNHKFLLLEQRISQLEFDLENEKAKGRPPLEKKGGRHSTKVLSEAPIEGQDENNVSSATGPPHRNY